MEPPDDSTLLIAIARQRDRQAFHDLFERHQAGAFNFALHILHDSALAQDGVQDAMLAIWESRKMPPANSNVTAWVRGIVANKCLSMLRQRKRQSTRETKKAMEPKESIHAMSGMLEAEEQIAELRSQLKTLPERDSQMLACYYAAGMSHREIAESFGVSHPTVIERIQKALERLRLNMAKAGFAAVTPVISGEHLVEAMTTGSKCPSGMFQAMMQQADCAAEVVTQTISRRVSGGATKSSSGLLLSSVVVAVCVAIAIGVGMYGKREELPPATPAAPVQAVLPVSTNPQPEKALNAVWDFKLGPAADLIVNGDWQWKAGDRTRSGAMVAGNSPVVVRIPVKIPSRPFVVAIDMQITPAATSVVTPLWCVNDGYAAHEYWQDPVRTVKRGATKLKVIFNEDHAVYLINNLPAAVLRFERAYPSDEICFRHDNSIIEKIAIQEMTPADDRHDPNRLIKEIMKDKANSRSWKIDWAPLKAGAPTEK
jgi:RNA polymerase sigma factor (sigma-70 family)